MTRRCITTTITTTTTPHTATTTIAAKPTRWPVAPLAWMARLTTCRPTWPRRRSPQGGARDTRGIGGIRARGARRRRTHLDPDDASASRHGSDSARSGGGDDDGERHEDDDGDEEDDDGYDEGDDVDYDDEHHHSLDTRQITMGSTPPTTTISPAAPHAA